MAALATMTRCLRSCWYNWTIMCAPARRLISSATMPTEPSGARPRLTGPPVRPEVHLPGGWCGKDPPEPLDVTGRAPDLGEQGLRRVDVDGATVGNQGFGHHRPLGRLDSARSRAAVKLAAPESGMRGLPTGRVMADLHRSGRSEEHTSELQSHSDLVCRLLLEKKKKKTHSGTPTRSRLRGLLQPSSTSLTMATPPTCGSIIPASRGEMPWTQRTVTGTSAMYSR